MQINPDQIKEWYNHPVTSQFFTVLKERRQQKLEGPRFIPRPGITADECALFNAYFQGETDTLGDLIEFKGDMIGDEE